MRRGTWILVAAACATVLGILTVSHVVSAPQDDVSAQQVSPPVYNPYPPGELPADLQSEIDRVIREIEQIEAEALAQWLALPTPTLAGNPPTLTPDGSQLVQILGKLMNYDKNLSVNRDVACAFCHMPYTGFTGPISSVNATVVAYPGSVHFRFGKRKPQTYTYSPYFPPLQYNLTQGAFYGGNFWDGRATGYKLQSADSEQAQHPPVDTQEHGLPDTACVVFRLSQAAYKSLFELVWGAQAFEINFPGDAEQICSTPGGAAVFGGSATPLSLSLADRGRANATYDQFAHSISAFEDSASVSPFSSKFDAFLAGTATLTADEQAGMALFNGQGNCNSCHVNGLGTSQNGTGTPADLKPVFTDFSATNLGLPRNPRNPFYFETTPDGFGFTPNPVGFAFTDLGYGLFLRSLAGGVNPNSDWTQYAPTSDGQMQTATTRNVDMRPCPTFVKAYMHNGYLKSLKEVVHFYNTRDVFAFPVESGNCPAGKTEKVDCWPIPEVGVNVDMTLGNLGLSDAQENQIVAFLKTLTDGFTTPYPDGPDSGTFTGSCP